RKTPITAADLLNDCVLPFLLEHDVKLLRVLTDRGSELIPNGASTSSISRSRTSITRAPGPRARRRTASVNAFTRPRSTNSIVSRFAKGVSFNRQTAAGSGRVDQRIQEARPHQGRWCFGKTPMQTFLDAMPMTKEKTIAA